MTSSLMILYLGVVFGLTLCGGGHPSDSVLIRKFENHRIEFEKLRDMAEEDKDVVHLSKKNVFYTGDREISDDRVREYREILRGLDLFGFHRDNPKSIRFIASTRGFPVTTSEKSFLYSTEERVRPLVESLDSPVPPNDRGPFYRRLNNGWYLVYESW